MRNKSRLRAIALSALPPIVAAALAIDIFLVDTFTPLEGAVAVLYVVVVLIAANILGRRGILLVSAACVVLAIASYVFAHALETSSASFRLFVSIAAIVITTLLALRMKSAQSALRRSEAYLAEAQRLSLTGSFGWAIGGQELYWSEETYRILGYEPGTIPTVALVMQRVHPDDLPLVQGAIDSAKQGARDVDFVHRLRLPDGAVKFIHVIARAIGNPGKMEYVGAVMDITAATQAEKALQDAQAELAHVTRVTTLGELAASIAHEVNQPLTAITTNGAAGLQWLRRQPPVLDEVRTSMEAMISDARRASDVIARIRALSRKTAPEMGPLDINHVVGDAVALIRRQADNERVAIRLDLTPGMRLVHGDRIQLQQVIINLAINGIQAMAATADHARELLIRTRRSEAGEAVVSVQDAGAGIEPDRLDRLFSPFYTTKPDGLGMGLSICRSIVEAHGGRIWASRNSGPGMTFQFSLSANE